MRRHMVRKCRANLPWRLQVATPARSATTSGEGRHMATKTLELHTATYPQIAYIPICWHRSNRYCFHFIIQSKWSLHRLSVETLTWPDPANLAYNNLDISEFGNNTYGVKRWDFYFPNVIFAMNEAHDLFKILKCMFCGVSPSDFIKMWT